MARKLFGVLSGAQVTVLGALAIVIPSAVYAVSFTSVAIVNPSTGTVGYVDSSGSLHTSDEYAYYRNNPLNYVQIQLNTGPGCATKGYTIPAGKALIITSIKGNYNNADGTDIFAGFSLWDSGGCTGNIILTASEPIAAVQGAIASKNYEYGNGVPVPAGSTLTAFDGNDGGFTWVQGFLVPANLVSASSIIYEASAPNSAKPRLGVAP
jgi:hypothetical protein